MSIANEIRAAFPDDVSVVTVDKDAVVHGENATRVSAVLSNGQTVEGTFTTTTKSAFGGVQFSAAKDIPALMIAKITSVLAGTSD